MPAPSLPGALLIAGGAINGFRGLAHALFTLQDIGRPRRIVPDDPVVISARARSTVRLSRGGATMWRAWVGFNLSPSLGALLFSAFALSLGYFLTFAGPPRGVLLLPLGISLAYLLLAVRYWFRTPLTGIAAATGCFVLAFLLY